MAEYTPQQVSEILNRIAEELVPGDNEFKKIIHAIVLAESGGRPNAEGDNGNSIGLFQANMAGGRGARYTKEQLLDPEFNARISIPELYQAYIDGVSRGISGADLVAHVSRTAQRPAAGLEWEAAKNYGRFVDGSAPTATPTPIAQAQKIKNVLGVSNQRPTATPTINPYERIIRKNVRTGEEDVTNRYPEEYKKAETLKKNREQIKKPIWQRFIESMNPFSEVRGAPSTMQPIPSGMRVPTASYTVRPGDTMWGAAERMLGSGARWQELQGYKGSPNQLPVGTRLTAVNPKPISGFKPTVSQMRPVNQATGPIAQGKATPYQPKKSTPKPKPTPVQRAVQTKSKPKGNPVQNIVDSIINSLRWA